MKIFSFNSKTQHRFGIFLLFLADILVLLGLFYASASIRKYILPSIFHDMLPPLLDFGMYYWIFLVWLFILIYEGAYSKRFTFWDEVKILWKCSIFASLTIFTVLFIGKQGILFSRALIVTMFMMSIVVLPVIRIGVKRMIFNLGLLKRKVLILGAGEMGQVALRSLRNEPNLGYDVVGFIDDGFEKGTVIDGVKVHSYVDDVERYIKLCGIHDIVIANQQLEKERLISIINHIQHKADNILYMPDLSGIAVLGTELRHFFNEQSIVIEIKNNLARPLNYFMKRFFDFSVGLLLLIILAVPLVIISLIIRLTSSGPALFRQDRIGKNGKNFMCYKFRTMYKDAEDRLHEILNTSPEARSEWDDYWKLKYDPRVTGIGKYLRNTSLDELPQIFNVLKGEMSLVGPRPYLHREIEHLNDYSDIILSVPPGITGFWQTHGRSETTYTDRLTLDAWYVRNWNLWLDIMILFKTVRVVLKKEGAV